MVRALVANVTMAVALPFAESETEVGETEHVDAVGAPPQVRSTDCAKPEIDATSTVKLTV